MPDSSTHSVDLLNPMRSPLETGAAPSNSFLPADPLSNALNLPTFSDRSSFTPNPVICGFPAPNIDQISTFNSGYFTVGNTGQVGIDYLFDGGSYEGELGIFSLSGLEQFDPGSDAFIQEVVRRILTDSTEGHLVIDDHTDAARFTDGTGWEGNFNAGDYLGVKTVAMNPGDTFGVALLPNGSFQQIVGNTDLWGNQRPLFSLATANPNQAFQFGQIADVTGNGSTFVLEDLSLDGTSDRDYNDVIFQVRGAIGSAVNLGEVINPELDWRNWAIGQDLMRFIEPPANQPLIGIIDTGLSPINPDIDPFRIHFGSNSDYVGGDGNPLLQPGEGSQHGTFITGIIGATQNNGIGIDGINNQAPIYVERAIGSGQWAKALTNFVDAAKEMGQPHAIANLSLDLTQLANNGNGTAKTRYEFTPEERKALEYARENHVLIVAAAGNAGGVMSALGQASQEFGNIITVGAADGQQRADYSSYGNGLDLLAPGGTSANPIRSTVGTGYGTMAGTSIAAAQVTGAASQMWAANPSLSDRQIIDILKSTATDLNTPGWDKETGSGLLNLQAAVDVATTTKPENFTPAPFLIPTTWSGEGKVQPLERAAEMYVAENFTRRVFRQATVYSAPNLNSPDAYVDAGENLPFDRWAYGTPQVDDQSSDQHLDALWYRFKGFEGQYHWIPSIDVDGYPPENPPYLRPEGNIGYDGTWYHQTYLDTFNRNGGSSALGSPAGNLYSSGSNGYSQNFQGGSDGSGAIMKSGSNDNSYWVGGAIWNQFQNDGGISHWGYPVGDRYYLLNSGSYAQDFQNGTLILGANPVDPNPGSAIINGHTISGDFYPVFQNYQGTLGDPIEDVQLYSGSVTYQLFTSGSIISSPSGTFPLYGAIRQAYVNSGGLNGWMGAPTSTEIGQGNGVIIQYFENGYVIWNGQQAIAYQTGDGNPFQSAPDPVPVQTSSFPPLFQNPSGSNPLRGFHDPLRGIGSIGQLPGGAFSHTGNSYYAIDFGVDIGTSVYSMRPGKVVLIEQQYPDTGGGRENINRANMVVIEHDNGYYSRYLHLQENFNNSVGLQVGQMVEAGQEIGLSGHSGYSSDPHLHVQVDKGDWVSKAFEIEGRFNF